MAAVPTNAIPIDNGGDDDDFQVHSNVKQNKKNSSNNHQNKRVYIGGLPKKDSTDTLEMELSNHLKTILPPDGTIQSIAINTRTKAPHAIVDVGPHANIIISKLHRQKWQGQILTVQREKRNNKNNNNNSNSNNWNGNKNGKSSNNHNNRKFNNNHNNNKKKFSGWSKPTSSATPTPFQPIPVDDATEAIRSVVESELQETEAIGGDVINTALASTAAATLLASMNAFGADIPEGSDMNNSDPNWNLEGYENDDNEDEQNEADAGPFQLKDMSALLADFGVQDPNWQKMQVQKEEVKEPTESRLAPRGKAPIHISLSSFGYRNGAPPRPEGWSQSQPLAPIDVREMFETVPKYLEWKDGTSGAVKKALYFENKDDVNIQKHAKTVIADQVWDALKEAQAAGYGYASPITMTIHIGSEMGKHRSVAICEWAAVQVRKLLRQNEDNVILQPISVGTAHRDIEQRNSNNKQKNQQSKSRGHDFGEDW